MKKNRRTNRKTMYLVLAFACVSLLSMTLVYASLSTTLKITGTAKFKDASFGLTLEELSPSAFVRGYWDGGRFDENMWIYGTAELLKKPTVVGTSINDYRVSLTKPWDEIELYYKLTNVGSIPVVLENAIFSEPIYTSSSNNYDDIELMEENFIFNYYIAYLYENDGELDFGNYIYNGAVLCPGTSFVICIENLFEYNATAVPSSNITISNLNAQFNFVATDNSACNGSTPVEDPS